MELTGLSRRVVMTVKKNEWDAEKLKAYIEERNQAAERKIYERTSNINPITGKPRRREKFEGAAYGWNPQNYWRKQHQ